MKRSAWFDVACNDPDNGLFAGRTHMIHYLWGDEYIELEADNWDGYAFTKFGNAIRLHRRRFEFIDTKGWVGNWCWDGFRMRRNEAKRFIGMLRESGRWKCVQGPTRWFVWFNKEEDLDPRTPAYGVAP